MGGVIGESNGEEGGMRRRGESLENSKNSILGKSLKWKAEEARGPCPRHPAPRVKRGFLMNFKLPTSLNSPLIDL